MVEAVVQRDEGETARTAGQVEVAYVRLGDDLAGEQLGRTLQKLSGGAHLLPPLKFGFSQTTVAPMPKPTHMVVRP